MGSAAPRRRTFLLNRERFIFNDLVRRSGAIVLSSSRGDELSFESDALQNGMFTEQILAAFDDPRADRDHNGSLSTDELRAFVIAAVAQSTGGLQHPTVDRDNLVQKFGFPVGR